MVLMVQIKEQVQKADSWSIVQFKFSDRRRSDTIWVRKTEAEVSHSSGLSKAEADTKVISTNWAKPEIKTLELLAGKTEHLGRDNLAKLWCK